MFGNLRGQDQRAAMARARRRGGVRPRVGAGVGVALALGVAVTACGDSGDGSSSDPTATPTRSAAAATTPAAVQGRRVTVVMKDFAFAPAQLRAGAGKLTVTARNTGQQEHELVLLRTDAPADAIPVKGGKASEAASVGEIGEQPPGKSASHSFTLKPGRYVFVCNVDGHYGLGMRGTLVVK